MELVRLTQKHGEGVEKLEESFLNEGYARRTGAKFYVQPRDRDGKPLLITDEEKEDWDSLWKEQDKKFIADCQLEAEFKWMIKSKFAVADGNHRLWAWMKVAKSFPGVLRYHPRVECVVLTGEKDNIHEVELAMHGVNRLVQTLLSP